MSLPREAGTGTGNPPTVEVLTGAGNWAPPADALAFDVEVIAGGGAGGSADGAAGNAGAAPGGGSAGVSVKRYTAPLAADYAYSVGDGGTPGAAGNFAGGNGADSTFDTITAKAGAGAGGSGAAATTVAYEPGGPGGVAGSGGDTNYGGQQGGHGLRLSASEYRGGVGAPGPDGGGGAGGKNADGSAGRAPGAGGGGGATGNATDRQGGAGAAGTIIVTSYT